jgi:hypothetical protein
MTFDTHLIYQALAALGITAGIAILMALAIIGIAATQVDRGRSSRGRLHAVPAHAASSAQADGERETQAA